MLVLRFLQRIYNQRALDDVGQFIADAYDSGVLPQRGPEAAIAFIRTWFSYDAPGLLEQLRAAS